MKYKACKMHKSNILILVLKSTYDITSYFLHEAIAYLIIILFSYSLLINENIYFQFTHPSEYGNHI